MGVWLEDMGRRQREGDLVEPLINVEIITNSTGLMISGKLLARLMNRH